MVKDYISTLPKQQPQEAAMNILYKFLPIEKSRKPMIKFKHLTALQVFELIPEENSMDGLIAMMVKLRNDSTIGRTLLDSTSGKPIQSNEAIILLSSIPLSMEADDDVRLCGQIVQYIQPPMREGSFVQFGQIQPNCNIVFRIEKLVYRKVSETYAQILTNMDDYLKYGLEVIQQNIKRNPHPDSLREFSQFETVNVVCFLPTEVILKAIEG